MSISSLLAAWCGFFPPFGIHCIFSARTGRWVDLSEPARAERAGRE